MRIGILGGGQLGKMLVLAGVPLGLNFQIYDPDDSCCARNLAPTIHGDFQDQTLLQQFAESVDVITYENENIPGDSIRFLQQFKRVVPGIKAIEITQDRLLEKECLQALHIPTTAFVAINNQQDVSQAAALLGYPFLIKTRRHGYDGKGQLIIHGDSDLTTVPDTLLNRPCIAEKWVDYRREFSVISVSAPSSQVIFYDLCENVHQKGILHTTHNKPNDQALLAVVPYIKNLIQAFSYQGVMAVEFFEDLACNYIVNEIAPRVHNSGHWTIEGAYTSQFQNHLRAILDWPLGNTASRSLVRMQNLIGTLQNTEDLLKHNDSYIHLYGKAEKSGRKLGHITTII